MLRRMGSYKGTSLSYSRDALFYIHLVFSSLNLIYIHLVPCSTYSVFSPMARRRGWVNTKPQVKHILEMPCSIFILFFLSFTYIYLVLYFPWSHLWYAGEDGLIQSHKFGLSRDALFYIHLVFFLI